MPISTAAAPSVRRCLLALISALCAASAPALAQQQVTRSDTTRLAGLERTFQTIASRVTPSVVAITVGSVEAPPHLDTRSSQLTPAKLDQLLANGSRTVGTGFCVDERGYIVTNQHVIAGARQIYVTTDAGQILPAMIVGTDPRGDVAVLKVPRRMKPVEFATSGEPRRGQWSVAVGNPIGLGGRGEMSFSVGVISATGRSLPKLSEQEGRLYSGLIQTTAELNPGNSGGPLFDITGRVIGIVTAVVLPQADTHGLGFALPADAAMRRRVRAMINGDKVVYGYLGVAGRRVASRDGLFVTKVGPGTPAAGRLREGDVILALGNSPVRDEATFIRSVGAAPTNQPVRLSVRRGNRDVSVVVRLDARPRSEGTGREEQRLVFRGITFANTFDCVRVLAVDPHSPLADLFTVGQSLRTLNGYATPDLVTLHEVLDRP